MGGRSGPQQCFFPRQVATVRHERKGQVIFRLGLGLSASDTWDSFCAIQGE